MLLIVMGVVIALAMSLASRSLSDTVLSRQELESSTAFRLAESGVESALNSLRTGDVPAGSQPLSSGIYAGSFGVETLESYGLYIKEGEQAYLDLTGFSGQLTIRWTKKSDTNTESIPCTDEGSGNAPAAIEVIAHRAGASQVRYNYYNPYSPGCDLGGNNFDDSVSGGSEYLSQVSYTPSGGTTALKIRPLYANATITVSGSNLATQLYQIESQAEGGDAQKEIEVKRGLDAPPSVFDFALFSGSTIVK